VELTEQTHAAPKSRDQWEQALDLKHSELQQCQREHTLKSCLGCSELLDCTLRDAYVKAVYESMSKGHGGGFEF
jgi:hypothetical protein